MVALAFFANRLLAPNHPNPEKLTSYECGEEPTGTAWIPFNARFYVIALIFLLFDAEMTFILPWATVFGNKQIGRMDPRWGWLSLSEMFVFVGILFLGLIYVWVKGDLDWIKPAAEVPVTDSVVPFSLYEQVNERRGAFQARPFVATSAPDPSAEVRPATATENRPPAFKRVFKKPDNES